MADETTDKVHYSMRLDKLIYTALCSLAIEDDRSLAYVIHEALKASPKVKGRMERLAEEEKTNENT